MTAATTRTVRVEITADHIAAYQGRWRAGYSVVEQAIVRATNRMATIGMGKAHIGPGHEMVSALLPMVAMRFIVDLNDGRPVQPLAFDLEIPETEDCRP